MCILPSALIAKTNDNVFQVGEKLEFKIYFEFIQGGEAKMEIVGIEEVNGNKCLKIVSTAKSLKKVDLFYKVRDKVESWRDVSGGYSRRFYKKLREGSYRNERWVNYFPDDSIAVCVDVLKKAAPETIAVGEYVYDVLNSFYEMRNLDLKVGEVLTINMEDNKKLYPIEIHVLRKESVKVPAGKFDCVVIEPRMKSAGLFRAKGKMLIWISNDEHKIPVLMKSKLYFGRVWAKLTRYNYGDK